ncbi:flagellar hook-basal body protein [Metabacillus litoralis]|uniref:flagellar hook-basal body protein n=1 Tax=Metabacillus litoralis TaxID=152268 RepID=UPI001CFD64CD|nr:flagellar hook-basal body protein [Metabacillus litoralis]
MLRGLYTATAGMLTQQRRTEMLSNNMANSTTPGYKADQSSVRAFPEMLLQRLDNKSVPTVNGANFGGMTPIGTINTGVYLQEIGNQYLQGGLKETGLKSDIALVEENVPFNPETNLKGTLLFAVDTPTGDERYTRNGHFSLDDNGILLSNGNTVLSTTGEPISIQTSNYEITPNGEVYNLDLQGADQFLGQIDVRYEADVRNLVREGNGLFRTADEGVLPTAIGNGDIQYNLRQNYVENSTVDVGRTYTDMMTAYRSFEANQKVLQAYDKSMDKAANEIGRLR